MNIKNYLKMFNMYVSEKPWGTWTFVWKLCGSWNSLSVEPLCVTWKLCGTWNHYVESRGYVAPFKCVGNLAAATNHSKTPNFSSCWGKKTRLKRFPMPNKKGVSKSHASVFLDPLHVPNAAVRQTAVLSVFNSPVWKAHRKMWERVKTRVASSEPKKTCAPGWTRLDGDNVLNGEKRSPSQQVFQFKKWTVSGDFNRKLLSP